ncbi:DUF2079 domain-containing protein [uncultured Actinomyces sp.]|uniref:DUF2079 domain-containing protein n=1 Tax=uncultured Actinomyces sp. TaxID=249061 RepID=UPI0028E2323A|nr:DUF2079 domain-containing protein [uncultured Actinomyces sp.]
MITSRPLSWQTVRTVRSTAAGHLPAAADRLPAAADRLPAAAAVLAGAWILIAYSVGQWRSITVPSWDLAIFAEMAKAYAHGHAPIVPIKGDDYNLLGDHFHPILVLLGPLWRLFPSPLMLLVVQDLLLAVSAWPLTRLATRLLGRSVATLLGVFYVLSWGFQGAAQAQFHEIAFAVPPLAWASAAFVERRWSACALWLMPLVFVKEDMGLTLIVAGGAIALRGWQDERAGLAPAPSAGVGGGAVSSIGREPTWWRALRVDRPEAGPSGGGAVAPVGAGRPTAVQVGGYLALFGALAFVLTVFIILPLLSPTGSWQYGLGGNSGDGVASAQTGGTLLERLFSPDVKVATLFMLACTAGLIGMASPWMALTLPTLGWRFLADKEAYWQWRFWHYNAVLIPIALGALLDVVSRLRQRRTRRSSGALLGEPAESVDESSAGWLAAPVWARRVVAVGVVVPLVTGVLTASDLPLWAMTQTDYGTTRRAGAAQQVLDSIPEGASVETDLTLLAYLVPKATVSWVGTSDRANDYVIVDSHSPAWGGRPPTDAAAWATQSRHVSYELILDVDGFQVAKRQ